MNTKSKETLNLLREEMLTTYEIRSISYSNKYQSKNFYNACWDEGTIDFNIYTKSLILLSSNHSRQTMCSLSCSMHGIIRNMHCWVRLLANWTVVVFPDYKHRIYWLTDVWIFCSCWPPFSMLVGWLIIYLSKHAIEHFMYSCGSWV